jgi:acyl carrier protein
VNHRKTTESGENAAVLIRVIEALAEEIHSRMPMRITLDSSLDRDAGLDSLARMELLARIESRFRVTLPERVFADAETPRDLLRALIGAGTAWTPGAVEEIATAPLDEASAPYHARTLAEVLDWHVAVHPDRPHIRHYTDDGEGGVMTYRLLGEGARAVAAGLQKRGLMPGEPVVMMLPTGDDYFHAFFGVILAGGVPVPIYPPARRAQIVDHLLRHRGILNNCRASVLILVPEARPFARALKAQV